MFIIFKINIAFNAYPLITDRSPRKHSSHSVYRAKASAYSDVRVVRPRDWPDGRRELRNVLSRALTKTFTSHRSRIKGNASLCPSLSLFLSNTLSPPLRSHPWKSVRRIKEPRKRIETRTGTSSSALLE